MSLNLEELKKAKSIDFNFAEVECVNAETVRELRKTLGLTQLLFASLLHVSKKTVEKWEEGKNPIKGGDAALVYLLSTNPSFAGRLLEVKAHNQEVPERFRFFVAKEMKTDISFDAPEQIDGSESRYLFGGNAGYAVSKIKEVRADA